MRWFQLHPKVKTALAAGIAAVGASSLGAWNGTTTWHETAGLAVGAAIAVITAYLTPVSPDA
jgi:hypothetical protein